MSLKYGKKQIEQMAAVLDGEYGTVNEAAFAALEMAEQIFEDRAKFIVVGQLAATKERGILDPSDEEAIKLALSWHSTEGDARSAADSMWSSMASGDTWRVWVLNMFHGSAAELHKAQKEKYQAIEAGQADAAAERLRAQIEKHKADIEERNRGGKGACTCSHYKADHYMNGNNNSIGSCGQCGTCPKFTERKSSIT